MPASEDAHPSERAGRSDPRGPGGHGLGPHAVGQRVVVRRLLPGETGPSGGPAMTDLLGDLVAWPDAGDVERVAVVLGEDGTRTSIPLADIVSGKPVPPRPSPRLRASARETEGHGVSLWPRLETEPLGEWLLRIEPQPEGRPRRRANSCLAMGDPGVPVAEAAARIETFYARRGRDPGAQVEEGSETDQALRALGWREMPRGRSELWLGPLASARRKLRSAAARAARTEADRPWLEESDHLARAGLGPPAEPVAVIEGAVDHDWLGIHGLHVVPTRRRRGLGSLVLAELLGWGAERGARTVWLHVETDNDAAGALYAGLGMARHHGCRYLRPPDRGAGTGPDEPWDGPVTRR